MLVTQVLSSYLFCSICGLDNGVKCTSCPLVHPVVEELYPEPTLKFVRVLDRPKHLVHMAANRATLVQQTHFGTALRFAPDSPFPGVTLLLKGVPAF